VLGVGGMGVVVAATHLHLEQKVALKFMLPEAFQNPEALARFSREARAAVKLKSEHVARVIDTGMFDNNSPYIVMEYLEGSDLAGELEKHGPLPVPMVSEYIIHACEALAEAHSLGIVHRDLKPAKR
jgi:serine/threonine protein kinase